MVCSTQPTPGEMLLPRNFGRGSGQIMLNMRVGRTFAFGPSREASSSGGGQAGATQVVNRRYSVTISMQIRNLTNHNNPGPIFGNITSPLFGMANQPAGTSGLFSESANNRRLELQTRLTF
jgi:hypothetical protein